MKFNRTIVSLMVFGVCAVVVPAHLMAAPINTLVPTKSELKDLPKFGFSGELVPGVGDRMTSITPGGRFDKLGVEVGDIILSVNGFPLTEAGGWKAALMRAQSQGATNLHMQIRDSRTGLVRARDISVNFSNGQPAAVKAAIVAKQRQLQELQVAVLRAQNLPEPARKQVLQQLTAKRAQLIREISQLANN